MMPSVPFEIVFDVMPDNPEDPPTGLKKEG
jgi:hypothetical protein